MRIRQACACGAGVRKWGSFMGAGLAFALMKASDNNNRSSSCWQQVGSAGIEGPQG